MKNSRLKLTKWVIKLINEVVERLVRLADDQLLEEAEEQLSHLVVLQILLDFL